MPIPSPAADAPPAQAGFNHLTRFTYGTTRLGDDAIAFDERVRTAAAAMRAGVWFHTSHQYGDALQVLRAAFDADRARVPPVIVKLGWSSVAEIREQIELHRGALGIEQIGLAQLCIGGSFADAVAAGDDDALYALRQLKDDGLVGGMVLEVFPWTSAAPLTALGNGMAAGLIDGLIFYLNPLQRFASNALWAAARKNKTPIVAMRTVAGGDVHRLRDVPGAAWKPYLQERAAQVAPLYERSGCATWPEFCARFVYGVPGVRSTVGATSRPENLRALVAAVDSAAPLPGDIQDALYDLQTRWADDVDAHAEPWTM